jgi:hypothetical protein
MAENEELLPPEQPAEPQPEPHPDTQAGSSADYANYQPPQKQRRLKPNWRKLGIVGAVVVVLFAIVGAVYWFVLREKPTSQPTGTNQTEQTGSQLAPAAEQVTTKTKHYVSQNFRLEFDYPEDWTASEDNTEAITVLSTDLKLRDASSKDVVGQVYFRIRSHTQKLDGLDAGNATAVRNSEKISYTKPTEVQRDSTYISFLRYSTSTEANTLDAMYITGDLGYQKDQDVPKLDIEKVDPVISFEFYLCPNSGCVEISGVTGIGISTWDNPNISGPLKSMLQSLTIQ